MRWWLEVWLTAAALCVAVPAAALDKSDPLVGRGRYLVQIGGCNDCHTPFYPMTGGNVPESAWLTGDNLGWRGIWGTTYATNLRLFMQELSEEQWLKKARDLNARPPMSNSLQSMTEEDLRALYRFVRVLGPAGKPAPAYVPPLRTPRGSYVQFPWIPM